MLQRPYNRKLMAKVLEVAIACSIDNRPCTINNIKNLEIYFKEYQIMVIDASYKMTNNPLFLNTFDKFNKHLYLFQTIFIIIFISNYIYIITTLMILWVRI